MATEGDSSSRIPRGPQQPRDEESDVPRGQMAEAVPYEEDDRVQGELVSYLEYKDQANSYRHYVNSNNNRSTSNTASSAVLSEKERWANRPHDAEARRTQDNNNNNDSLPIAQAVPLPLATADKDPSRGRDPSGRDASEIGIEHVQLPETANHTVTSTLTYDSNPTATSTLTWQTKPQQSGGGDSPAPPKAETTSSDNVDWKRFMKKYGFVILFFVVAGAVALGVVVGTNGGGDDNEKSRNREPILKFDLILKDFRDGTDSSIGYSVSLDGTGTRLCVTDRSFVYVYEEQADATWEALGSVISPPNNTNPDVERKSSMWIRAPVVCRLSADGQVLAVGWSTFENNTGFVQVYRYQQDSEEWQAHGQSLQGVSPDSCFGTTLDLDLDGGVLAVGSPGNGGSVFVYFFNVGSWEMFGAEIMSQIGGMVITSVSLSSDGETLGIGGRGDAEGCVVEIFRRQVGDWVEMGSCIEGIPEGPAYTVEVAAKDGSIVAISNHFLSDTGSNNEDLDSRVFEFVSSNEFSNADGEWVQQDRLHEISEGEKQGYFISLSEDGRTLVMGDPGRGGQNQGHAHLFKYDSSKAEWYQYGPDIVGSAAGDQFGYAVAISSNGKRFSAGSPFSRALGTRNAHGRVLVYEIPE